MEKIIDRENKEAVKALKKDNFYFGTWQPGNWKEPIT